MRISLIFLILCYSLSFGQTTIFVKYRNDSSSENRKSIISHKINETISSRNPSLSKSISKVSSLSEHHKILNSSLNNLYKIELDANSSTENIIESLKIDSDIEYVQIAQSYSIDYTPTDSLYEEQWGLRNINAENAWELIPDNSKEIILAVIDTGIDFEHPDIDGVLYHNTGEMGLDDNGIDKSNNGIDDDLNGFIDDYQGWDFVNKRNIYPAEIKDDFTDWDNFPMDEHGHGTNVAGIIGAEHNSIGIAGVNPKVKILNLRAFDRNGNGEEDDAASAIIYAVNMGAKIINMSWGDSEYSKVLKDIIEYAYENDVILIGSSGNSGSDLPHFPSGFSEVVSVGAIQENDALAGFSNYGSTIDLVAPGSQIITLTLDNKYKNVSGTSVATPYVSAAASIISSIKDFSNEEVKHIL